MPCGKSNSQRGTCDKQFGWLFFCRCDGIGRTSVSRRGHGRNPSLLGDCGGSNGYRSHTFKHHLQNLANDLGLPIQVAHYPVHCSKYNPIERREFCHVERSFSGRTFETASDVAEAAASTTTKTGLTITTVELPEFEPVCRSGKTFPEPKHVQYDEDLPDCNYTLTPQKKLKL